MHRCCVRVKAAITIIHPTNSFLLNIIFNSFRQVTTKFHFWCLTCRSLRPRLSLLSRLCAACKFM
ncbi:unnamed protein product [Moneuplotes crassus]|uniref:Uncharacterized protein n=1 Tax=Euplotes crassus TaxID=5936 RepID=A0AAD1Y7S0_EUPCR|nr:unnamed protein product [Moneuplotes crassus]